MKRFFPFILIFIITLVVWGKVLGQAMIAEGSAYFSEPYVSMIDKQGLLSVAKRYDFESFLFFKYIGESWGTNMPYYMAFLLLTIVVMGISLYALVKEITKSSWASMFVVVLFLANDVGSIEMLGIGYYNWFIERIPNFIPAVWALFFLVKYYREKKLSFYFVSFAFYLIAVVLARYTLFMFPVFLALPFATFVSERGYTVRKFVGAVFESAPFMLVSYWLLQAQDLVVKKSGFSALVEFISTRRSLTEEVVREVGVMSLHPTLIIKLARSFLMPLEQEMAFLVGIAVLVLFSVFTFVAFRKKLEYRSVLLALLLAIPASALFQIYINPSFVNILAPSRYLYLPSMLFSIFAGILLFWLWQKKFIWKIAVLAVVTWWFFYNQKMISQHISSYQKRHDAVLDTIDYVCSQNKNFPDGSVVLLPSENGYYGSNMLTRFCSRNFKIIYEPVDISKEALAKVRKNYNSQIITLKYRESPFDVEITPNE